LDFQRTIKKVFDPDCLLNPGKVIPKAQKKDHNENPVETRLFNRTTVNEKHNRAVQEIIKKISNPVSNKTHLRPIGNGTNSNYGNNPNRDLIALSSSNLNSIIEYDPHNQTVVAGAGISLDRLQDLLEENNQWLPVRPPLSLLQHTLGGLVALGACGPERLHYGAPRDLLLGLRFIDGLGRIIATGGRVMKNVAGYDLSRLMTASAGTLGFITDVTFRIESRPERCTTISASGSLEACSETASTVLRSHLPPQWVVSIPEDPSIGKIMESRWLLMIGYEGFREAVGYMINHTEAVFDRRNLKTHEIMDYSLVEGHFRNVYEELNKFPFLLKAGVPLNGLLEFVRTFNGHLRSENTLLDLGLGRLFVGLELMEDGYWSLICEKAGALGGHVLLEKAPQSFKQAHEVFGTPHPSWKVTQKIKDALDPDNIFSPGCLPGKK
jgi:FAD/FMN-containing dehydrogenase